MTWSIALKKIWFRWIVRALVAYVFVLFCAFAWNFGLIYSKALQRFDAHLFKPVVGFAFQGNNAIGQELTVNGVSFPRDPRFSAKDATTFDQFDRVVFLFSDFSTASQWPLAKRVFNDVRAIEALEPGAIQVRDSVSLKARLNVIPFYVERLHIVIVNSTSLLDTYRPECLVLIISNLGALRINDEFRGSCAISAAPE